MNRKRLYAICVVRANTRYTYKSIAILSRRVRLIDSRHAHAVRCVCLCVYGGIVTRAVRRPHIIIVAQDNVAYNFPFCRRDTWGIRKRCITRPPSLAFIITCTHVATSCNRCWYCSVYIFLYIVRQKHYNTQKMRGWANWGWDTSKTHREQQHSKLCNCKNFTISFFIYFI